MPTYVGLETSGHVLLEDGVSGLLTDNQVFSTPVLDNFNRVNAAPLSGGIGWSTPGPFTGAVNLLSNQVTDPSSDGSTYGAKTTGTYGPYCEAFYTILLGGDSGAAYIIGACCDASNNFYELIMSMGGGGTSYTNAQIIRQGTGGWSSSIAGVGSFFTPGDQIGIRVTDKFIEGWVRKSSFNWQRVIADSDTAHGATPLAAGSFVIAMRTVISGNTFNYQIDNFGGGVITPPGNTLDPVPGLTGGRRDAIASSGSKRTPGGQRVVSEVTQLARRPLIAPGRRPSSGQAWPRRTKAH